MTREIVLDLAVGDLGLLDVEPGNADPVRREGLPRESGCAAPRVAAPEGPPVKRMNRVASGVLRLMTLGHLPSLSVQIGSYPSGR